MKTIQETFFLLDDWEERYDYLISLGRGLPIFLDADKTEENSVRGCVSKVWMILKEEQEGVLRIQADSVVLFQKIFIALVIAIYDGKTRDEIKLIDVDQIFVIWDCRRIL